MADLMHYVNRTLTLLFFICATQNAQSGALAAHTQSSSYWKAYVADPFWKLPKKYQIAIGIGGLGLAAAATYKAANSWRDYRDPKGAMQRALATGDQGKLMLALNRITHDDFKNVILNANRTELKTIHTASTKGPNGLTDDGKLMLAIPLTEPNELQTTVNQACPAALGQAALTCSKHLTDEQKLILLFSPNTFNHNFNLTLSNKTTATITTLQWLLTNRNEDVQLPSYVAKAVPVGNRPIERIVEQAADNPIVLLCSRITRTADDSDKRKAAQDSKLIQTFRALLSNHSNRSWQEILQPLAFHIPDDESSCTNYITLCEDTDFTFDNWVTAHRYAKSESNVKKLIKQKIDYIKKCWITQLHDAITANTLHEIYSFEAKAQVQRDTLNALATTKHECNGRPLSLIGHSFITAEERFDKELQSLGKWLVYKQLEGIFISKHKSLMLVKLSEDAVQCGSVSYLDNILSHYNYPRDQLDALQVIAKKHNASENIKQCIEHFLTIRIPTIQTDPHASNIYLEDQHRRELLFPAIQNPQWILNPELLQCLTQQARETSHVLRWLVEHRDAQPACTYIAAVAQDTSAEDRSLFALDLSNPAAFLCCRLQFTDEERRSIFEALCCGFENDKKRHVLLSLITVLLNENISRFDLKRIYGHYHYLCEPYFHPNDWAAVREHIATSNHHDQKDISAITGMIDAEIAKQASDPSSSSNQAFAQ